MNNVKNITRVSQDLIKRLFESLKGPQLLSITSMVLIPVNFKELYLDVFSTHKSF